MAKYNKLCIGIDQSYKNCGVSISADGQLLKVNHIKLEQCRTNTDRRKEKAQVPVGCCMATLG